MHVPGRSAVFARVPLWSVSSSPNGLATRTAGDEALRSQGRSAQWLSGCLFQLPERELIIGARLVERGQRGVVGALRIKQFKQTRRTFFVTERGNAAQLFDLFQILRAIQVQRSARRQ